MDEIAGDIRPMSQRSETPVTASHTDRYTRAALALAVSIPFLYYGIQLAAACFYPGYSFLSQSASMLGSDLSPQARIFNIGIMTQGAITLLVSPAFALALLRVRVHPLLAWPVTSAITMNGVQSLWSGYYTLPDPRHGGHPIFLVFMLALPVLFLLSLWKPGTRPLRAYLLANLGLLLVMVPIMSRMINLDAYELQGLFQRIFTLTIFPPIAVTAAFLRRRLQPGSA